MIIAEWTQFKQLRLEAWKSQVFNGVWTRDLAIPVRRSNQLSYEATDVRQWSRVQTEVEGSNLVEILTFSGLFTQLRSLLRWS